MHSYRMSAMQEAYDGLGDETFDLLMALHLEDAITAKPQDMNGEPASLGIPMDIQIFVQELAQYQEDRRSHGRNPPPTNKGAENACLKQKKFECLVCGDQVQANEAWTAPCSHHYCIDCLENFHRACLADQTLYPPKCCHLEMPWSDVKPRINHQLARTFEGKREELNTDAGRRTYCFYPPCARFIGPSDIKGDLATCPTCRNVTCTMCKAASHGGDCPADETLRQTLQLASEQGWKRCNNCRSIVELTRGCNHITYVSFPPTTLLAALLTDIDARAATSFATHVSRPGGRAAALCGLSSGFWLVMVMITELLSWHQGQEHRDMKSPADSGMRNRFWRTTAVTVKLTSCHQGQGHHKAKSQTDSGMRSGFWLTMAVIVELTSWHQGPGRRDMKSWANSGMRNGFWLTMAVFIELLSRYQGQGHHDSRSRAGLYRV